MIEQVIDDMVALMKANTPAELKKWREGIPSLNVAPLEDLEDIDPEFMHTHPIDIDEPGATGFPCTVFDEAAEEDADTTAHGGRMAASTTGIKDRVHIIEQAVWTVHMDVKVAVNLCRRTTEAVRRSLQQAVRTRTPSPTIDSGLVARLRVRGIDWSVVTQLDDNTFRRGCVITWEALERVSEQTPSS